MKCFHVFDDTDDMFMFDVYADYAKLIIDNYDRMIVVFYCNNSLYCTLYNCYYTMED